MMMFKTTMFLCTIYTTRAASFKAALRQTTLFEGHINERGCIDSDDLTPDQERIYKKTQNIAWWEGVRGLVEDVGFFGVFAGIDFYFNWEAQKQGEQMVGDYCANEGEKFQAIYDRLEEIGGDDQGSPLSSTFDVEQCETIMNQTEEAWKSSLKMNGAIAVGLVVYEIIDLAFIGLGCEPSALQKWIFSCLPCCSRFYKKKRCKNEGSESETDIESGGESGGGRNSSEEMRQLEGSLDASEISDSGSRSIEEMRDFLRKGHTMLREMLEVRALQGGNGHGTLD